MAGAGNYRFRLKRMTPIPSNEGATGYRDSGETWWAAIDDTKSNEDQEQGTAIFSTLVNIRIRNQVNLGANDRLVDTSTGEIYHVHGIQRNQRDNETIVLGERRVFGQNV